jgi:Kae1-associated kinase Bud32
METIDSGAEAVIKSDGATVVKERIKKDYRIPEIDDRLRKSRTKREAKVINKLNAIGFPAPLLKNFSETSISMEHINGSKLRDVLQKDPARLGREIGRKVGLMHNTWIVHGDLTTSNMILEKEIKFIDFGLSFFSKKLEDKAVDLHLLRQALESKHYECWQECFDEVLKGYKETGDSAEEVIERLKKVELRGRNKH